MTPEQLSKTLGIPLSQLRRDYLRTFRRPLPVKDGAIPPDVVKQVLHRFKEEIPILDRYKMSEIGVMFNCPPHVLKKMYRERFRQELEVDNNNCITAKQLAQLRSLYDHGKRN